MLPREEEFEKTFRDVRANLGLTPGEDAVDEIICSEIRNAINRKTGVIDDAFSIAMRVKAIISSRR
jgi:hypothetical protein